MAAGMGLVAGNVSVSRSEDETQRQRQDHWANGNGTKFTNPWPSFRKTVSLVTLVNTVDTKEVSC